MPNTLITGSSARTLEVAAALQKGDGTPPLCADTVETLDHLCASIAPRSLDCYIQLPSDRVATATVTEASVMAVDGARFRYAAVATVRPLLSEAATVVLVMGGGADSGLPRDLAGAVNDLTRVLARALHDDSRATDLRIRVVGSEQSAAAIASIARREATGTPPMDWYVDFEPTLGAADWRCEMLSLVEPV